MALVVVTIELCKSRLLISDRLNGTQLMLLIFEFLELIQVQVKKVIEIMNSFDAKGRVKFDSEIFMFLMH